MTQKQMTTKWWEKCLKDKEKLEHWLIALYNNEHGAAERFISFANTYCSVGSEEYNIFLQIAEEEKNHSRLVEELLLELGIEKYYKSSDNGKYFRNTLSCIYDKKTAAAIGAYAETLSLKRMQVIIDHKGTPDNLRDMFKIIEPDERGHVLLLSKIATKYGMAEMKDCHEKGLDELGLKIKNSQNITMLPHFLIIIDNKDKIISKCKETFALPIYKIEQLSKLDGKDLILFVVYECADYLGFDKIMRNICGYSYSQSKSETIVVIDTNTRKQGLYKNDLTEIYPIEYNSIKVNDDNTIELTNEEHSVSIVNMAKTTIIPFGKYDYIEKIKNTEGVFYLVEDNFNYGVINGEGNIIIPTNFEIINLYRGFFVADDKSSMMYLFNLDGSAVLKKKEYIGVYENYIETIEKDKTILYNLDGSVLLSNIRKKRLYSDEHQKTNIYVYNKVKNKHKYGLINLNNLGTEVHVLTEAIYEDFEILDNGEYLIGNLKSGFDILHIEADGKVNKVSIEKATFENNHLIEICYSKHYEIYFHEVETGEKFVYFTDCGEIKKYSDCFN